jgi:probable rRNA maturation factor
MKTNYEIIVHNSSSKKPLPKKQLIGKVHLVLTEHKVKKAKIGIILVDDIEIHRINKEFLEHDYPTDVITFPLDEEDLEGEIYISQETAKSQAEEYGVSLQNELQRLAIHGTLHLLGYEDSTEKTKKEMTKLEDKFLSINV